ncbi:MAG: cyclase/dehydrase [Flavobacterium sp.]|nr:cyclase/dehydrase [Pedobacter sp.]
MATSFFGRDLERFNSSYHRNPLKNNLSWSERLASIGAGTSMFSVGLRSILSHPLRNGVILATSGYMVYRGVTGYCPVKSFINSKTSGIKSSNVNIRTSVYVDSPRREIYDFWRKLENLPLFMSHLKSVKTLNNKRSRWEAVLPGNIAKVSWEAEIVNDDPGNVIGWKSIEGSEIDNAGKVEFTDAADGHGTVIQVVISYLPPSGGYFKSKITDFLSPVFEKIVRSDINNFKKYLEDHKNHDSRHRGQNNRHL